MPQVAICDDNMEELGKLSALLDEYRLRRSMELLDSLSIISWIFQSRQASGRLNIVYEEAII